MMSFQNILSHMIPIKTNLTLSFLIAMHYNKRCFIGSPFSIPYMPNGQWTWLNLFFCNKLWKFIVPHLWKCFCYKPSRLWTTSLHIGADYDMYFLTFFFFWIRKWSWILSNLIQVPPIEVGLKLILTPHFHSPTLTFSFPFK